MRAHSVGAREDAFLPDDPDPSSEATRLTVGGNGAIAPGTLLCHGTYRIEERLGAGGMGEVYRGVNTGTGSRCAIKTMIRHELVADRFLRGLFAREAEALKSIRHGAVDVPVDHRANIYSLGLLLAAVRGRPLPMGEDTRGARERALDRGGADRDPSLSL